MRTDETSTAEESRAPKNSERDPHAGEAAPHAGVARISLDAIFADTAEARAVVLAVSGGPDSMALMRMAAEWAKTHAIPFYVATVDHGLRPELRREAEQVAIWAQALGLPHQTLIWDGNKPTTRIQERARDARYGLLDAYAAAIGADYLMTAHHADDQAETTLFRLLRGSGLTGLAGMPRVSRRGGIVHLRPLLDHPKADLIAYCDAAGQAYLRDPSNENPAFARVRLRKLAPALAQIGLDRGALLRLGRRAARADAALDIVVERLRASLPAQRDAERFSAPIGTLAAEPDELFARVIAAEITRLAGGKPLRLDRLETLAMSLQHAAKHGEIWRGSLAGLAVVLDRERNLSILPEKPRRRGRLATENSLSS